MVHFLVQQQTFMAFMTLVPHVHVACRDVQTLLQDLSAEKALSALKLSKRKSLPVVDDDGNLVSLFRASCIAPHISSLFEALIFIPSRHYLTAFRSSLCRLLSLVSVRYMCTCTWRT